MSNDPTRSTKRLQVVMTTGPEDLTRSIFALDAALAAAASGVEVQVFLTLAASEWACAPRRPTASRVHERIDQLLALGVGFACCSACASEQCDPRRRAAPSRGNLVAERPATDERIRLAGLTAFLEGVVAGVPTLTF